MKGRLLDLTLDDPYSNVALEEALVREAKVPTLRVWENQRSVVIGRGQLASFETDLDFCRARAIPVVRRVTAGGAVYNGPGNLNWTFCVQGGSGSHDFRSSLDARGVFRRFAAMVVGALEDCGAESRFVPPNTIEGAGGKISGMAAFVSKGSTICHGTLLVAADLDEVQRLTRPSPAAIPKKYPRSRYANVANCGVDPRRFKEALSMSGEGFIEGVLDSEERSLGRELAKKYGEERWNLGDPFSAR